METDEAYPEGTRCGRKCDLPGYSFDHSPTDKFVGKEKYTATTGGHGKYNFIPASDAVCTCGHQYSWPRSTHDYYGEFYPDEYFGAYCEWNYGNGPLSDYKPVLKKALQQDWVDISKPYLQYKHTVKTFMSLWDACCDVNPAIHYTTNLKLFYKLFFFNSINIKYIN